MAFVLIIGGYVFINAGDDEEYSKRIHYTYEVIDKYQTIKLRCTEYLSSRQQKVLYSVKESRHADVSRKDVDKLVDDLRMTFINNSTFLLNKSTTEQDLIENLSKISSLINSSDNQYQQIEKLLKSKTEKNNFNFTNYDQQLYSLLDESINYYKNQINYINKKHLKSQASLVRFALAISMLATCFTLFFTLIVLQKLKKPFDIIADGAQEFSSGNLKYRIKLNQRDEFSYLAKHFNTMANALDLKQQKLNEAKSILEKKVEQRTRMLLNLNTELNKIDQQRRQFLSDISHEIRTPLTVLRGEAELLLRSETDDITEYRHSIYRILDLAKQLSKYAGDLVGMARNESNTMTFNAESFDFALLLQSALEDLALLAEQKSLIVSYYGDKEGVIVNGDLLRIKQLFLILFENACRYSNPNGKINVELEVEPKALYLMVSDTGIGIPYEDQELIFQRRFRSDNAAEFAENGTGLGLAIAKSIVESHGGTISVESIVNIGSTFTIYLPIVN